jgi:hypothetical protein
MATIERQPEPRDLLFGDLPASQWPAGDRATGEPWESFVEARGLLQGGATAKAVETFQRILAMPDLESRHYLQAWHQLRLAGAQPSAEEGKRLYGVLVEVSLEQGLDVVAAYLDLTARYFNYSGRSIIWDRPNSSLDENVHRLLEAGRAVVKVIGPWEGPRPPAPRKGDARINFLTPSGLHFGQAKLEQMSGDPMGGPVIARASQLMEALIAKTQPASA